MSAATIAAISSPPGPGRRGVIRLSGAEAAGIVRGLIEPVDARARGALGESGALGEAGALERRGAFPTRIHDGRGEQPCLLLWMPGPASYTREDVAELHLPGAPPLLDAALERVLALGAVPAAPGEFTRRAFLSGRLDLTQAEGVLALVDASNERERRAGLALLEGGLTERLAALRDRLWELCALAEASLDFDEVDTGHVPSAELEAGAAEVAERLAEALAWEVRRQPPSTLPRVVLCGRPNAGKSTLFNALVEDGRALVSDVAGSTRDGASGLVELTGGACLLLDAPGVDSAARGADRAAQELAAAERAGADLLVELVDASDPAGSSVSVPERGSPGEEQVEAVDPAGSAAHETCPPARQADDAAGASGDSDARPRRASDASTPSRLRVWSRVDRPEASPAPPGYLPLATTTGRGLPELRAALAERLGLAASAADPGGNPSGAAGATTRELNARHRRSLEAAGAEVAQAREALAAGAPLDLVATGLRAALDELDGIEGHTTPEDLLDRIFARFCLGK